MAAGLSGSEAAPARPRRRRWRVWLLLLAVLLSLPALFAWWLLDPATVLSILRQSVRETVGLELDSAQPTRLIVVPAPRLALREVHLQDLAGRRLATIERVDVELPWQSLWTRPPALGRIALSGIDLHGGKAMDDWLALWSTGPASPSLRWPELARGLSIRRLRYFAPASDTKGPEPTGSPQQPPPPGSVEESPAQAVVEDGSSAGAALADTNQPLFELEFIDLDPVASGAPLNVDLAVLAQSYRLGLNLRGRADDSSGSLRVLGAELALAFGPIDGDDEVLRVNGELDLSYLPAGGLRGGAQLVLEESAWIGARLGLPLSGPWQIELVLRGEEAFDTDIEARISGAGLEASANWPLGPTAATRLAELRLDYEGADGLMVEGLRLTREPPADEAATTESAAE
jgi:hypothetical protein